MTRDEALKIMQETTQGMYSYERLSAGTYLDGYEQGVRDSAKRCDCGDEGGSYFAEKVLALLDVKEKKG
jgi:hypothetical protein